MAVSAGSGHVCTLSRQGALACWGVYDLGRPPAGFARGLSAVAAGSAFTCALKAGFGTVRCWGLSDTHQTAVPVDVRRGGVAAISAGDHHACAIMNGTGALRCWGGSLDGLVNPSTVPEAFGGGVAAVSAGGAHTCAVRRDGVLGCWGYNAVGQTTVPDGWRTGGVGVAAGAFHTCALQQPGPPSATVAGDPHMTGFNGIVWDFNQPGEFVLLRDGDGTLVRRGGLGVGARGRACAGGIALPYFPTQRTQAHPFACPPPPPPPQLNVTLAPSQAHPDRTLAIRLDYVNALGDKITVTLGDKGLAAVANSRAVLPGRAAALRGATLRCAPASGGKLVATTISAKRLGIGVFRRTEPGYGAWINIKITLRSALKAPVGGLLGKSYVAPSPTAGRFSAAATASATLLGGPF